MQQKRLSTASFGPIRISQMHRGCDRCRSRMMHTTVQALSLASCRLAHDEVAVTAG